jgi:hypothetical protein
MRCKTGIQVLISDSHAVCRLTAYFKKGINSFYLSKTYRAITTGEPLFEYSGKQKRLPDHQNAINSQE